MKKINALLLATIITLLTLIGCSDNQKVKLDPNNPVTISVWHYYNGSILNAFEAMISEFNETVGIREGIIVESYGLGNVTDLENAVMASVNKEIGSNEIPNIFASYADTAYAAEKLNILANLNDYFTEKEKQEYLDSYIKEGEIGLNGELRILPIAKSTEVLLLNETDWQPFADSNNLTFEDLATIEDVSRVSKIYYEWTDSATPDIPNDGKAFFGRDSMANFFIIASKEFGTEIFYVENGVPTINVNKEIMRKIWDNYYVPYISGYFTTYGKFRSDDAKVGDILAYVGSTSSASYFPTEVTADGETHSVNAKVLPTPYFEDGQKVMVQQGAGMVVTQSTPEKEYASVLFLKWFTDIEKNIEFSSLSGYMPVKKDAIDYDKMIADLTEKGQTLSKITDNTLKIALNEIKSTELYTNKAFDGGADARYVLENNLQDKAVSDRESVLKLLENGETLMNAVNSFNTEENFNIWLEDLTNKLHE